MQNQELLQVRGLSCHPDIYVSWSTSELRVRLARRETGLSPPIKYFYWPFQGGTAFVVFMSCVCHDFASVRCCLVVTWRERADLLALVCEFVTFPFGVVLDRINSWSLPSFLPCLKPLGLESWYLVSSMINLRASTKFAQIIHLVQKLATSQKALVDFYQGCSNYIPVAKWWPLIECHVWHRLIKGFK